MVSHSLQKALGEKFREEQRFLLVSIETNSDQEGRGFLSSVHFSEAGSAAQCSGGPVWKPQSSGWVEVLCPWACGTSWNRDATSLGALAGTEQVQGALAVPVPGELSLAGGSGAERGCRHWARTNPTAARGEHKRGDRLKESVLLCQN